MIGRYEAPRRREKQNDGVEYQRKARSARVMKEEKEGKMGHGRGEVVGLW